MYTRLLSNVAAQSRTMAPKSSTLSRAFFSTRPESPMTELTRDFLEPEQFYHTLKNKDMNFFTGVPDSLLADFCAYVTDHTAPENHVIGVNEGHALTLASGYHFATGKTPVVYMQNSGFGNVVNPLLSMCDPKVYSVPALLLIGWRGEPGKKDEPQHLVQGKIQTSLLASMNINFEVLPDFLEGAEEAVDTANHYIKSRNAPYALLVKRQTFTPYSLSEANQPIMDDSLLTREETIERILDKSSQFDALVTTTGFTSREVYEYRNNRGQSNNQEFLTVGCMGYASSIAQGVAMAKPSRQVFCIDGDGAALMHMGSMASIGTSGLKNYKHILVNNGCHDSVGGQPTIGNQIDYCGIARACGYNYVATASTEAEIDAELIKCRNTEGPVFLEIKVKRGTRKNLGRPKASPVSNKIGFMQHLSS